MNKFRKLGFIDYNGGLQVGYECGSAPGCNWAGGFRGRQEFSRTLKPARGIAYGGYRPWNGRKSGEPFLL